MSGLEKALFNLKVGRNFGFWFTSFPADLSETSTQFTAKQLNRQAAKAGKDETAEKNKLKKVSLCIAMNWLFRY
jgi:charged multivesicular body protein 1